MRKFVPVLNVRGQYNHLIVRALGELGAESTLLPTTTTPTQLREKKAHALVVGGGPQRVHDRPPRDLESAASILREVELPILTICVGHQLLASTFGGETGPSKVPEFGPTEVFVDDEDRIFRGLPSKFRAWSSHNDEVIQAPANFKVIAHSRNCAVEGLAHNDRLLFGVQFHPEVSQTEAGPGIFRNFLDLISV